MVSVMTQWLRLDLAFSRVSPAARCASARRSARPRSRAAEAGDNGGEAMSGVAGRSMACVRAVACHVQLVKV